MPVYEYQEGKRIVERVLPIDARDTFPGRLEVPTKLNVCPRGEPSQGDEVLRGFHRCEQTMGTEKVRQCAKALGMTRDQVKKVWTE